MEVALRNDKRLLSIVVAVWVLVTFLGLGALTFYASTPGALAAAPERWPAGSAIVREPGTATLIMLAHPRCVCTRASVHEFAKLMDQVGDKVRAYVVFVDPAGLDEQWDQTDLWRSATAIPGVEVVRDVGGVEARRFGATTSGQVLLYDGAGRLMFRGGITSSRGHEGDNVGRERIVALLAHSATAPHQSPVFGCALDDHDGGQS